MKHGSWKQNKTTNNKWSVIRALKELFQFSSRTIKKTITVEEYKSVDEFLGNHQLTPRILVNTLTR